MTVDPSGRDIAGTRAAWPWWAVTIAYFVATCLMHLQFSLWLIRPHDTPWGRYTLSDAVPAAAVLGMALLGSFVVMQLRRSPRPWALGAGWLLWVLAVLAIDRWLTYSTAEYFHYPQYALLAWLIARLLDPGRRRWIPGRVLFWTTLLGAADELLQYLWITASYSHYLDFNDVLVNLVAAAAGVLIYYGAAVRPAFASEPRRPPAVESGVALVLALAVAAGLAAGRLQPAPATELSLGGLQRDGQDRRTLYLQRSPEQHGSWQRGPRRGQFYVLTPLEGLLSLGIGVLFAGLAGGALPGQAAGRAAAAATISPSSAVKSR